MDILEDRSNSGLFCNLFTLYLDGVLSQSEFFDLVQDLVDPQKKD